MENLVAGGVKNKPSSPQKRRTRMRPLKTKNYYLGPFVISSRNGMRSIIDGQQCLISLTLLLIFLNHLQKKLCWSESIEPLIFSEKYGQKSFNIQVEEKRGRTALRNSFFEGAYDLLPHDEESAVNMSKRYADIEEAFSDELKGEAFPYFLDWFKYNVIVVEITVYSDDNAYTIFELMNDRGLNLTSAEILKEYILSRFDRPEDRSKVNRLWKNAIQCLYKESKEDDQQFFQAWLRSQYADTIRQSRAGSSNEDLENIGTRFHSWFWDNPQKIGIRTGSPDEYRTFLF